MACSNLIQYEEFEHIPLSSKGDTTGSLELNGLFCDLTVYNTQTTKWIHKKYSQINTINHCK